LVKEIPSQFREILNLKIVAKLDKSLQVKLSKYLGIVVAKVYIKYGLVEIWTDLEKIYGKIWKVRASEAS
jgi:hypothetical protein